MMSQCEWNILDRKQRKYKQKFENNLQHTEKQRAIKMKFQYKQKNVVSIILSTRKGRVTVYLFVYLLFYNASPAQWFITYMES
jgi:hypothetical protein